MFELTKTDKGNKAEKVKLPGGKKVTCERDDREIDEETMYTGTVKFFAGKNGFGFIIPDEESSSWMRPSPPMMTTTKEA